ncbi:MAG TPA: hypothetical protein DDZ88_06715 [Verrucomicrobiales bacterium]|nr:hypothetical protein [Verrucomicrobiales bacterium]
MKKKPNQAHAWPSLMLGKIKMRRPFPFHGVLTTLLCVVAIFQIWFVARLDDELKEARREIAALQKRLDEESYIRSRWIQQNQLSREQVIPRNAGEAP